MPKPTVGRIVLVTTDPERNAGQAEAPALVTGVHDDDLVSLLVFHANGGTQAVSGLALHDDRAAVDRLSDDHRPACAAYWPTVTAPAKAKQDPAPPKTDPKTDPASAPGA